MLKEGITAQVVETPPEPEQTSGTVVARRKANFAAAVGATSEWRSRLDAGAVAV